MGRNRSKKQREKSRKNAKQAAQEAATAPSSQSADDRKPYKPKAGPGQIFKRELVGMDTGHAKRLRNIGITPLSLAFHRNQLIGPKDHEVDAIYRVTAEDRFAAGERFEELYRIKTMGGKDSTVPSIRGGTQTFFTEAQVDAVNKISKIALAMPSKDFRIVVRFCGEQMSMAESLRGIVEVHASSVTFRIREALDALVAAMTGRSLGHVVSEEFKRAHGARALRLPTA
jgi:hypothetical protein